ncbi:hypothetical protein JKP88DRAFT_319141 [Tribonema minus]|uniref:EF-hand domain-containing protein n=1 Tax=Tribonema minus TaxID=303371 RepID=A0A835YXD0_9STRA|nr:hypothetical protein JKP88DRAFT_319141 [Tribonema minus]
MVLALGLSDIDVEELFSVLGDPGPGGVIKTLETAALLAAVRGELEGRRLAVVEEAFRLLDEACCGAVPVETLLQRFAAEGHPDVVARARDAAERFAAEGHPDVVTRARDAAEVLTEWLETVDVSGDAPGCATRADFVDYYTSLSATIASDDAFEAIVRGTWRLPPTAAAAALSHGVTAAIDADWARGGGGGDGERGFAHEETPSEASAGSEESLQGSSLQSAHEGVRGSGGCGRRLTLGKCTAVPPAPPSVTSEDAAVARAGAGAMYHTAPSEGGGAAATAVSSTGTARATAANGATAAAAAASNAAAATAAAAAEAEVPHGLRAVLARLQRAAARGGMRGVAALSRELRAAAAQHCGTLGLREFKHVLCAGQGRRSSGSSSSSSAAAAAAAVLTEAEARMLFAYLDAAGTGRVPPARAIDLVRGALPPRARALAAAAFQNLLKNSGGRGAARLAGRGLVDARELVRCFNAAAHPDVRAGRATAEAVLREFLDTFECGAATEGHVSDAEFEEYHAGAALCLRHSGGGGSGGDAAAAAALEELIRGCWGLPHAAAASDGSSSPRSALETEAQHHHEYNSIDRGGVRRLYHAGSHGVTQCLGGAGGGTAAPPRRPGPASPQRAVKLRGGRIEAPVLPRGPDAGLLSVMNSITAQLRERGPAGFVGLRRALRTAAGGGGGGGARLTLGQLKGALEAVAADVGDAEARMLHAHLAAVHNDQQPLGRGATVALADVVAALRPPLPPRRAALAKAAFAAMCAAAAAAAPAASLSAAIAPEQAAARFDAAQHPDVACGVRPAHAVLGEMLEALEASAAAGGVTRADFLEYAACVSAAELSDARYERVMRGCWGLGAGDIAAAAPEAAAAAAAAAQGPEDAPRAKAHVYRHSRPSAAPGVLPGTTSQRKAAAMAAAKETAAGRAAHARQAAAAAAAAPVTSGGGDGAEPDVGVQVALSAARARLAGVAGAAAAARALSAADGDGDGLLTLREFRRALADAEAGLDDGELRTVFAYLDEHTTGFVPVRRAAAALRPPLSPWRRVCVRAAFARVVAVLCDSEPAAAAAAVPLEALLGAFNAAHHPEVIAARAAAADVRRDFRDGISALRAHGSGGGGDAVTLADFEAYYAALGGGIASDGYFELLLRGCWGLAEGALPTSPVRRRHAPRAAAPLAGSDPTPLAVTERLASRLLPPPPPLPPPDTQPLPPPPLPRGERWCNNADAAGPCGNGAWLTRRLRDALAAQPGAFTALRRTLAVAADQYVGLVAWNDFSRALAAPALALTQTDRQCLFDHFAVRAASSSAQHEPAYVDVDDFLDAIEPAAGDAGADSHLPPSAPPPLLPPPPPPPMVTRFAARDAAAAARPQSASLIQPHVSAAAAAAAAAGAAAAVNLEARRQRLKALAGSHIDFAVPLPLEHRPGRRLSTRAMAAHLTGAKVECEGDGGRGTERAHVSAPHAHPFADHLWGEQRELLQEAGQQQRQQRQGGGKWRQAAVAAGDVQPLAEAAAAAATAEAALLAAAAQQRQQQQQQQQQSWPSRQHHDDTISQAGPDAESVRRFCGRRHITPRNVPGAAGVTTTGKGHGVFSDAGLQAPEATLVAPAPMASVLSPTWASSIVLG